MVLGHQICQLWSAFQLSHTDFIAFTSKREVKTIKMTLNFFSYIVLSYRSLEAELFSSKKQNSLLSTPTEMLKIV